MIEIICRESQEKGSWNQQEETICLPKNIRQMGSPRGRHKIYLEDYVYTYLRTMARKKEACAAVFLGKSRMVKDIRHTFISGAIECGAAIFQWERICLDESFWDYIYKEEKQYFPELEIVGWFLGKAGEAMELTAPLEAAHRKYFAGRDKVLMLMDILEEEELFFVYEQGYLQKREGYYIYYEKNLCMQEYMIRKKEEEQLLLEELEREEAEEENGEISEKQQKEEEESFFQFMEEEASKENAVLPEDRIFAKSNLEEPKTQAEEALESYRRMILERQGKQTRRQERNFLYTASSFFLVVLCVIGITTINNYRKMQRVEDTLHMMNHTETEEQERVSGEQEELLVETVESQVEPLDETKDKTSDSSKQKDKTEDKTSEDSQTEKSDQDAEIKENSEDTQETTATGESTEPRYYTVQPGDTLDSICMSVYQNRDMLGSLREVNGIGADDKILVGQKLLLP